LRFARNDKTTLPGYESDDYIEYGSFDKRNWQELISEFETVRRATVSLFNSLDEIAWTRQGIANNDPISVRALAYIIAGHELHHVKLIRELYLV
jgi:DinB superfamily